jgi:hypothetical protein
MKALCAETLSQLAKCELLAQLKSFGLNPNEWLLDRRRSHGTQLVARHRQDAEFRLLGSARVRPDGQAQWRSLSLLSL